MLNLIAAHPLGDGAALFLFAWLLASAAELAPRLCIACVAAAMRGIYRGQTVAGLRGLAFFLTVLAAMCAPVFIVGILS